MSAQLFDIVRNEDLSGVSGTGLVAEGCEFSDGTFVVRWLTALHSTAIYATFYDAWKIHGHEGRTIFVRRGDGAEVVPA